MFLIGFLRRKHLLDIVYEKLISYDFCTSFVFHKVKKTFGRFQVEALRAYQCKKILGPESKTQQIARLSQLTLKIRLFKVIEPKGAPAHHSKFKIQKITIVCVRLRLLITT